MKPTPAGTILSHHSKARIFWDIASVTSGKALISISTLMNPWQSLAVVRIMVNVQVRVTQAGVQSCLGKGRSYAGSQDST